MTLDEVRSRSPKQGADRRTTTLDEVKGAEQRWTRRSTPREMQRSKATSRSRAQASPSRSRMTRPPESNWKTAPSAIVTVTTPQAMLYSPLDKGAAGNGVTDDTAAILAAITQLLATCTCHHRRRSM